MNTVKGPIHRLHQRFNVEIEQVVLSEIVIYYHPVHMKVQLRLEKRSMELI